VRHLSNTKISLIARVHNIMTEAITIIEITIKEEILKMILTTNICSIRIDKITKAMHKKILVRDLTAIKVKIQKTTSISIAEIAHIALKSTVDRQ